MPSSRSVLIVEDDDDIRESLCDAFRSLDMDVYEARNGKFALELLESIDESCVIVLDLRMPELDGVSFLSELQTRGGGEVRYRVIVASADTNARSRVERFGVIPVLAKPYGVEDLLGLVTGAIPAERSRA